MKPFTTYHFCREASSSCQQRLVNIIVNAAQPAMIFLLGASFYDKRSESIFQQSAPASRHVADYIFLILMKSLSQKEPHEWEDKIEAHCKVLMPVTTLVLRKNAFEEWLKEGHPFATSVQQSAVVFYNSESGDLPVSHAANHDTIANAMEKYGAEGLTKSKEFLAGSELYRIRKQQAMAAFMLHLP